MDAANGAFVAEGARTLRQAVEAGWPIRSALIAETKLAAMADVVDTLEAASVPVYSASESVLGGIAGFQVHRGVLALVGRPDLADPRRIIEGVRAVLVVEGVNDHENLGAMFRNAAALGVGAVILDPLTCDPLYRRSVRVSVGHVLTVPFARIGEWPAGLGVLKESGFPLVALSPSATSALKDLPPLPRFALMVGAEGSGLTPAATAAADYTARIPMAPGVDSLNVATAAAIGLYHMSVHRT
jgi:tRNA G18 (ribose-2'-O)-methylase SpoU